MNNMDEKLRILLCEDDENLGMLLREYLQAKGYSAELCPDGEAGYKAFLKNKYDLCVLDVMMPKKDGFTLAQEIRQANAEIPIIFLTAKTLKEDIEKWLENIIETHGTLKRGQPVFKGVAFSNLGNNEEEYAKQEAEILELERLAEIGSATEKVFEKGFLAHDHFYQLPDTESLLNWYRAKE